MITKSGLTGDSLLAYRGFCKNCGSEQRIYWHRCDYRMQRLLLDEREFRTTNKGLCEVCYIEKGHTGTVNWEARLPYHQADRDLAILNQNVHYEGIEENEKEIRDNDAWWDNQEHRVKEYKEHLKNKL